jgi:hypothetical protein
MKSSGARPSFPLDAGQYLIDPVQLGTSPEILAKGRDIRVRDPQIEIPRRPPVTFDPL